MSTDPLPTGTEHSSFAEIEGLREEVRVLSQRVDRLSELVERRLDLEASSSWSGTLVGTRLSASYTGSVAEPGIGSIVGPSLPIAPEISRASVAAPILSDRERICREIGVWLRRNLEGDHRGNSGRFKLPEASKFYIIIRDYSGHVYTSPAKVVDNFSQAKHLCCQGGKWGNSVFIGLPSLKEIRISLEAGGFDCPPHLLDGRD